MFFLPAPVTVNQLAIVSAPVSTTINISSTNPDTYLEENLEYVRSHLIESRKAILDLDGYTVEDVFSTFPHLQAEEIANLQLKLQNKLSQLAEDIETELDGYSSDFDLPEPVSEYLEQPTQEQEYCAAILNQTYSFINGHATLYRQITDLILNQHTILS